MNILNGRLDGVTTFPGIAPDEWVLSGTFVDNSGSFTALDVQVGARIFNDGTLLGQGTYVYRIITIDIATTFSTLVCTIKWDRPPLFIGDGPYPPIDGTEFAICAVNYDAANVSSFTLQVLSEPFVNNIRNEESRRVNRKTLPATATTLGIVRLDTAAVDPLDPVVLGTNSTINGGGF